MTEKMWIDSLVKSDLSCAMHDQADSVGRHGKQLHGNIVSVNCAIRTQDGVAVLMHSVTAFRARYLRFILHSAAAASRFDT